MYNNAGKSIKNLVKVIVVVQMILYVIVGLLMVINGYDDENIFPGILVAGAGCLVAWLSGLVLYAFGDIAEGVKKIEASLEQGATMPAKKTAPRAEVAAHQTRPGWICFTCKTANPYDRAYCIKCNTNKGWSEEKSSL